MHLHVEFQGWFFFQVLFIFSPFGAIENKMLSKGKNTYGGKEHYYYSKTSGKSMSHTTGMVYHLCHLNPILLSEVVFSQKLSSV
jgi:hypothetical protein